MLRLLALLIVLCALMPGCFARPCEATPFAALPVAALRPPVAPPAPDAIAACPWMVSFDGRQYTPAAGVSGWRVEDDALTELGPASGSNTPLAEEERNVYALDGVPPSVAIALRLGDDGGVAVLVPDRYSFSPVLCPYLQDPETQRECRAPGEPAPTKAAQTP